MSNRPTPETDAAQHEGLLRTNPIPMQVVTDNFARKLERERDEARENLEEEMKFHHRTHTELIHTQCKILDMQMGRDEIQNKYDTLAVENMLEVNKLCKELDDAKEALMKIEDLFINGTDIYADRENMGLIARAALEEAK
jgi:hypothetical protein